MALALAEWLLEFTDRPYGDVFWRFPIAEEINDRWADALTGVAALRAAGRTDDATRLAGRLGGAGHLFGHTDELVELLSDLWPSCDDGEATADALLAQLLCADIARRPELSIAATGMLGSMEGPAGHRHRVFVHCLHALFLMFGAATDRRWLRAGTRRAREGTCARGSPGVADKPRATRKVAERPTPPRGRLAEGGSSGPAITQQPRGHVVRQRRDIVPLPCASPARRTGPCSPDSPEPPRPWTRHDIWRPARHRYRYSPNSAR